MVLPVVDPVPGRVTAVATAVRTGVARCRDASNTTTASVTANAVKNY